MLVPVFALAVARAVGDDLAAVAAFETTPLAAGGRGYEGRREAAAAAVELFRKWVLGLNLGDEGGGGAG